MKSVLALGILVFLMGCGNNSSSSGSGGGAPPAARQQGSTPFTKTPWCSNFSQNGQEYQQRLTFNDDKSFSYDYFELSNGSRGNNVGTGTGTWTLNGDQLTTVVNGNSSTSSIRLDPRGAAGAPQLHVTDPQGSWTYDPCH